MIVASLLKLTFPTCILPLQPRTNNAKFITQSGWVITISGEGILAQKLLGLLGNETIGHVLIIFKKLTKKGEVISKVSDEVEKPRTLAVLQQKAATLMVVNADKA